MRIYVHEPDAELKLHEDVEESQTFREICTVEEQTFVFLDDDDEPVGVDLTIVEVVIARGRKPGHHHVHRHHCREITVEVHYGGDTRPVRVTPNQTVATVLNKAIAEYGIDPAAGADLVLRRPGSNEDLPQAEHIGDLHAGPPCSLELNLLPAHREAG
jgi:hypothetical protein